VTNGWILTALVLLAFPAVLVVYAYVVYPLLLMAAGSIRRRRPAAPLTEQEWPSISICVPVFNEAAQIRSLIESLLRLDYPADRVQKLIVSDASNDGTDEIVAAYADRGIELLRIPVRGGKTAGENIAIAHLRGDIIVNTDASIRVAADAIKPLIAAFADPAVGVASGRDISVATLDSQATRGESSYVGYEMWVRDLETRVEGIVGASGCLYAIRSHLHAIPIPAGLARDFASALTARVHGYRAVSVTAATCLVPRNPSLHVEYRRKVRTITRGLQTLFYRAALLNPFRFGAFSWLLFSHKLCRWAVPPAAALGLLGAVMLALGHPLGRILLALIASVLLLAAVGWRMAARRPLPRLLAAPTFIIVSNLAALHAWHQALTGRFQPIWEPTRREQAVPHPTAQ
jgi:glycosyltransferase involved in cell wall biosynthesis